MLIRVGSERSKNIDLVLAALLSAVAGGLNAVGFLVAGSFTANMTGNVSLFVEHLAQSEIVLALSFAGLALAFIVGAGLVAFAIQLGERHKLRETYALAILAEALLLLVFGMILVIQPTDIAEAQLVLFLSFVMGLQNAVTTMISKSRVRTTHVSGMATDIGIEIAALVGDKPSRHAVMPSLKLHLLTLSCFIAGGLLGVITYSHLGHWVFIATALLLTGVALPEVLRARRSQRPT